MSRFAENIVSVLSLRFSLTGTFPSGNNQSCNTSPAK